MRKSRTGEYFKFVEFLSFQPQKFEQTSIPDSLSWRSLIFEFPSQNFSKSLRRIVCSIAESRMKVWFFRTHAVIEKYSIILRIRNKLNASAFRSRTLNENRTVPPPLLPLAAPTLKQSSLTILYASFVSHDSWLVFMKIYWNIKFDRRDQVRSS